MFFMDAHIYRRKTVRKKQKSSGVLSNKICAAETSTNGDQKECSLGEEQNVVENLCTLEEQDVQNQCTLDLNTSQGSNEVAIRQSTSDNITEELKMDTEPFHNDDGRDNSSGDVDDQPLTVVQKVHDTYSSKFSTISSGQLLPTGTPSNIPKLDSQLQSLVQNKFQDIVSKLDHLGSKSTKNIAEPDEENSAMAKFITAKLRKIDQSKKNEFKFGCMKILYDN